MAILRKWDFQQSQNCVFDIEKITEQGGEIPSAVEAKILSDLFDLNEFKDFVLKRAKDSDFVGSLMDDLTEPPPPNVGEAIPFLGETKIYEFILTIAAGGDIVLNVGGTWIGRRAEDASDQDTLRYIRSKAFRTGQEMRQIQLGLPGAVGGGAVTIASTATIAGQPVPVIATPGTTNGNVGSFPPTLYNDGQTGSNVTAVLGKAAPPVILPDTKSKKSVEPATGINLSGCFETWGISSSQSIESARIEFSGLTAQQIKQILLRIPSTFKATLDITYKEGGQE